MYVEAFRENLMLCPGGWCFRDCFFLKNHFESWSLDKSRTTEAEKLRARLSPSFLKQIVCPARKLLESSSSNAE